MTTKPKGNALQGLKPVILMVIVQIAFAGVNILYKLAVNDGMSLRVTVAYRFIFATAFIAPFALFFERKKRVKLTWMVLFQSFLCGLFGGALAQNFYLEALALTSATFASAMANLIPAITFVMAVCIGLERLNLGSAAGKAKIIGTMAGIAGAMVLTFVKGPEIQISSHVNLMNHRNNSSMAAHGGGGRTVLGSVCALASGISYALWLIIQTKMSERYPSYYSSTALMSLWAAILSTAFALSVENDWSQWRLGWNIRLLTVAYSGMVVSGMMVAVISWCVRMRGPLFASVFSPLLLVIVAVASSTVLNEKLYLGSFIGAVLIVCGLYAVLWGKSKERKKMKNMSQLPQCPHDDDDDTVQVIVARSNSKVGEDRKSNNNGHVDDNQGSIDHGNNNKGITGDQEQEEKQNDEEGISPNAEDIIPSVVI
ncbi:WAT1-related protein At1g68170 [Arachis duranensis]|uniref:WAT1-related protein At1g68170 n=1 Tax=Arachis duranensis TaxID=130453 RepID=A0A6P4C8H6_ARADU|nr:WAT1-related protein At1g68170 [Arachis duranensis]